MAEIDLIRGSLDLSIQPTGVRTFFLSRTVHGRRHYARIGNADEMTISEARREARRLIASYIDPVKKGNGPRTPGRPTTEFTEEFLDRQAHRWKPRTLETNAYLVRNHILPAFGHLTVDEIAVEHVRDWFASMANRPGIFLPASKSGPRTVWLSSAACAVIDVIPRYSEDCPYLFPARPPTRPIDNFEYEWHRIRNEAGLPGLRLHDLRHTCASVVAMNGVDMVTVAKLLGHALVETTERYTHISDQFVADTADRVSNRIHAALVGRNAENEEGGRHAHMPTVDLAPHLARQSKAQAKDVFLFDKALPGFGLRIHPSGWKVWIVQARIEGRSRRIVIARHGEMKLAEARRRTQDMLTRVHAGGNPAEDIRREKEVPAFREFADEYLRRRDPYWKPSGRKTVRIYLNARIPSAFCKMPLDRIHAQDVAAWFDAASKDKPGAANRASEILRLMMIRAEERGLRERGTNPCLGIES